MLMDLGPLVWLRLLLVFGEATGVCWLVSGHFGMRCSRSCYRGGEWSFPPLFWTLLLGWMLSIPFSGGAALQLLFCPFPVVQVAARFRKSCATLNWPKTPHDPQNDEKQ